MFAKAVAGIDGAIVEQQFPIGLAANHAEAGKAASGKAEKANARWVNQRCAWPGTEHEIDQPCHIGGTLGHRSDIVPDLLTWIGRYPLDD